MPKRSKSSSLKNNGMRGIKLFIYSIGGILLAAALIRFLIAAGSTPVLDLPDPLLGIPLRYAVLTIGGLELTVAIICLFGQRLGLQVAWLAWLATDCAVYWTGLCVSRIHPQASCIGSLTDPLLLSRGTPGFLTAFLPVYLVLGSYASVVWLWLAWRKAKAAQFLRMSCPSCGIHIRFDDKNLGQKISCPHCRATVTLRKPDLLKISCFFCHEHIEFPVHALGQKIKCPHCQMDITLMEAG